MAAMTFVSGMCIFQLTRNVLTNPDVRYALQHPRAPIHTDYMHVYGIQGWSENCDTKGIETYFDLKIYSLRKRD